MRILFVHEVDYRAKVLFEMHELPELLALRGHDVTFFHYVEEGARQLPLSTRLRTRSETMAGRAHGEARIKLVSPPVLLGGLTDRVLATVGHLPGLRRTLREGRFDALFLYSVPTTGWQAIALAHRLGVPVLFRAIDVSHSLRETPFAPLIKRAERAVYKRADLISANNPALADYIVQCGAPEERVRVDLPPLDLNHFAAPSGDGSRDGSDKLRARYGIGSGDRVILFMGTLFRFAGLEAVIRQLADELRSDAALKLVILGAGENADRLRAVVDELSLHGSVIMTGRISYDQLPEHLRMADVAVNPFERSLTTDCALPHKVFQYMASGVPAVSTRLAGLHRTLGDTSGVEFVDGPAEVARAATLLSRHPDELKRRRQLELETVGRLFDLDRAVTLMEDAIRSLAAQP